MAGETFVRDDLNDNDCCVDNNAPWTYSPNVSYDNIEDTVPGYFNGVVLQRKYVDKLEMNDNSLKLPVVVNLVIVWIIVFVCLSKGERRFFFRVRRYRVNRFGICPSRAYILNVRAGLKSYSKVVYAFSLVPVFGMFMLCTKMIGLVPFIGFQHQDIFPETDWSEFFLNTKVRDR